MVYAEKRREGRTRRRQTPAVGDGRVKTGFCIEGWCTVAARLTDRQKKKILADYVQTNNYCATAKINGVSATTVKNLVRANADIVEKCEQKKEENTADVMEYMNDHKDLVCSFIGKGLEMLNDPEKLAAANLSQITTAMGTLIDKWTMVQEKAGNNSDDGVTVIIDV